MNVYLCHLINRSYNLGQVVWPIDICIKTKCLRPPRQGTFVISSKTVVIENKKHLCLSNLSTLLLLKLHIIVFCTWKSSIFAVVLFSEILRTQAFYLSYGGHTIEGLIKDHLFMSIFLWDLESGLMCKRCTCIFDIC